MTGINGSIDENKIPLVVLVGPTAVGKSSLAMRIAINLNTAIISADSAQVYCGLNIGTAKPFPSEQALVKHYLIDLVDPRHDYSVADYQKAAEIRIEQLWQAKKLPLLVGGTGLYIKAVTDSYAFGQKGKDPEIREKLNREAEEEGPGKLHQRLLKIDPQAAASIHPNDRRRIIRALEVHEVEGRPISKQVADTAVRESRYNLLIYGLSMPRQALYRRIDNRVDAMIAAGWKEEVAGLLARGYTGKDPGLQVIGYRQLAAHLQGELALDDALADIKKQTRNYAKRQLTWFKREKRTQWFELTSGSVEDQFVKNICADVKEIAP